MAAVFQVPAVFRAIDKMSAPIRRMQGSVRGFANTVGVAEAKVVRSFRSMTRAVGGFGLALGATALIMVAANAIGVFKDFEQANANLSAVMGKTIKQTVALQNNAKTLGATTSFTATEVVGLQTEYAKLGFVEEQILQMTSATLSLAAATNTELSQAAKQTGAVIKAFGLEAQNTAHVADILALSTTKSALDMEFFATAMAKVAPIAKQAGFSLADTSALFASLADSGFEASIAATSTKNILLEAANANSKLAKAMGGPARNMGELIRGFKRVTASGADLTEMLNLTDKRSVAAFATFLEGSDAIVKFATDMEAANGAAKAMADTQLNTLTGSMIIAESAYQGFILSLEDGQGAFAKTLRTIVDVTAKMLNIAAGVKETIEPLDDQQKRIKILADRGIILLKVLKWTAAAYITMKIAIAAVTAATWLYQTAQAVNLALQGKTLLFLKGNTAATIIYKVATFAMTAAIWLWGAAQTALNIIMTANPIGFIIVGIAALIALIAAVVIKYQDWGAALTLVMGPLGMIINLIMSFARHWDSITAAFKSGGILAGLKRIGLVIFDAILMPLQQMLELLSSIPGIGDLAASGAASIEGLRTRLDLVNPQADQAGAKIERQESISNQNLDININNRSNGQAEVESSGDILPTITPTFAF